MRSVKEVRRKAAAPKGRKVRVYSTSEARANFAQALETAQAENAVIGFDRYGRTIAALVPIEAVYMLAGMGRMIAPGVRKGIESDSRQFVQSAGGMTAPEPAPRAARRKGPAKKAAPKSARKTAPKKKAKRSRKGRARAKDARFS